MSQKIELISYATPSVSSLRAWWVRQMCNLAALDTRAHYVLHLGSSANDDPRGWHGALLGKLKYTRGVIDRLPDGSIALFSDLDVQPLRPYSELLPSASGVDLVIMREPQPAASDDDVYNSGLWLLNVSRITRRLLERWIEMYSAALDARATRASARRGGGSLSDQTVLRRLIAANEMSSDEGLGAPRLRFRTWPEQVVAGRVFPWLHAWQQREKRPRTGALPQLAACQVGLEELFQLALRHTC